MTILGVLRSTYLYAALSIAGGAIAIALVALLSLALELAGLRALPVSDVSIRERVSVAVAILIFALPVGGIHLWLVARSLRDEPERTSGPSRSGHRRAAHPRAAARRLPWEGGMTARGPIS